MTAEGPGRPRLVKQRRVGGNPREEILDAAGELFTTRGYAGTSTRKIADAVGMRQASLYHHFATKEDILEALLEDTVRPTLDFAADLDLTLSASARLEQLVRWDVTQLLQSRWNLGALYLLPELRGTRFEDFQKQRRQLADLYQVLSAEVLGDRDDRRTRLPFRLVESVINMRSDAELGECNETAVDVLDSVVRAVLRILG